MSTTGVESWATDLSEVAAIYPFQGTEFILAMIGLATWIGWHIWCLKWEKGYHREVINKYGNDESLKQALDND